MQWPNVIRSGPFLFVLSILSWTAGMLAGTWASKETLFQPLLQILAIFFLSFSIWTIAISIKRAVRYLVPAENRGESKGSYLRNLFSTKNRGGQYFTIEDGEENSPMWESIVKYRGSLRSFIFDRELSSTALTRMGLTIAIVLISVPVITWVVILYQAFGTTEKLPNAWLLVVSSTATGGLGMSIAVVILKHVNNDRNHLIDIQDRVLNYSELALFLRSSDVDKDTKNNLLNSFARSIHLRSKAVNRESSAEEGNDRNEKILDTIISFTKSANS